MVLNRGEFGGVCLFVGLEFGFFFSQDCRHNIVPCWESNIIHWRDQQGSLCAQLPNWKQKLGFFPEFQLWVQLMGTRSMSHGETVAICNMSAVS